MAITKNLLPKSTSNTQQTKPNTWEQMQMVAQFIDSIDTTGGEMSQSAKFNLLVSSVPSPWSRVHLTQHAIMPGNDTKDTRTLTQFYNFLRNEWRGLIAAYVLYPEDFELTKPIDLVSKDMRQRDGMFDIISTYAEMLFENTSLWKHVRGDKSEPKIQLLYYHNGDNRFLIGATSPFSILFSSMNYRMQADDQRMYWITQDGKFQDPASKQYEIYYKEGEVKYNDKHYNNLKKLYSFLYGVQKNTATYIETLKSIWDNDHNKDNKPITTDARYYQVQSVLSGAISAWMNEIKDILGENNAERSQNIPVNHKRPEGPLGELLNIKATYYWKSGIFYTKLLNNAMATADGNEVKVDDVERLFIDSDYIAVWRDCAVPVTDSNGKATTKMEHDYRMSPVHFIRTVENGVTWFIAVPFSEFALDEVFKQEFAPIIKGGNNNVKIEAEKIGNRVDIYLKARIDGEGEWVNIRNRSFNTESPNPLKKVFAWPNFCSAKWQKYYYYSEFPTNATTDVQMVPVFDDIVDVEDTTLLETIDKEAFLQMAKYPADAATDTHAYEIMRTNKPLRRIKMRKRIGNSMCDLGWIIIRRDNDNKEGATTLQVLRDSDNLTPATVGFDFGSTNSCAYYAGQDGSDVKPVPFTNRRLAIIGFDNKPVNIAEHNELLFISNEEPCNKNGQIKSWLHEHDPRFINQNMMGEELIGGVPVNETNIKVNNMDRYQITTNAGRLHYNMKWLVDTEGSRRKTAFVKMIWIQIYADLFAEGLYPNTLNWSYPSAMGANDMGTLESIFSNIPSPCPDYRIENKNSYTEAEAVCSYFLDKRIALENYKLFVGIDIGGSTSDILVLGKETNNVAIPEPAAAQQAAPAAVTNAAAPTPSYDYDEMGRRELSDLALERRLASARELDDMSRSEIVELLKANEGGAGIDYDELSRSELCDMALKQRLASARELDDMSRSQIVELLKANEGGAGIDYDELSRSELSDLALQRRLASARELDDMSRSEIVELLKARKTAPVQKASAPVAQPRTAPAAPANYQKPGQTDRRLYTQCSVRMAAGVFFDAILGSKRFRDCIVRFHASRTTNIRVEDINSIESNPQRAPYYLNNIFDQLKGDKEFKTFYNYLKGDVPFVFTLPAYIVGALMTYSGMLVRNAILTQNMQEVEEVHFRYFGKGGRLFEWLFFSFNKDTVESYLDACFNAGLKNDVINARFGRNGMEIKCIFDNCSDDQWSQNDNSENKSEVARGLVSRHEISGIQPNRKNFYGKRNEKAKNEYDARKQEVIGEIGIKLNGVEIDELALVDDNFYEYEGAISVPRRFENFSEFMNIFLQFVGNATPIYPQTNSLDSKVEMVSNVRNFIVRDSEYRKYVENIRKSNNDSYRMPIFIATALYYLEEVLLREVFGKN